MKIFLADINGNEIESIYIPIIDCSRKKIYIDFTCDVNEIKKLYDIINVSTEEHYGI